MDLGWLPGYDCHYPVIVRVASATVTPRMLPPVTHSMNANAPYRPPVNGRGSRRSDSSPPGTVRAQGMIKISVVALFLLAVFIGGILPIIAVRYCLFGWPF